jgi:hypothetical protein
MDVMMYFLMAENSTGGFFGSGERIAHYFTSAFFFMLSK